MNECFSNSYVVYTVLASMVLYIELHWLYGLTMTYVVSRDPYRTKEGHVTLGTGRIVEDHSKLCGAMVFLTALCYATGKLLGGRAYDPVVEAVLLGSRLIPTLIAGIVVGLNFDLSRQGRIAVVLCSVLLLAFNAALIFISIAVLILGRLQLFRWQSATWKES